jgi:Protein of unknown function (DUF1826)
MKRSETIAPRPTTGLRHASVPASTIWVDGVLDVAAIAGAHVSVAVFRRRGHDALATYAQRLARDVPVQMMAEVSFGEPNGLAAVDALARVLPADDARDALIEDIAFWVEMMTELTGAPHAVVRVLRPASPVFPGFYVDPGTLRLVCTYAGATSEWLDRRDVDWSFLGDCGFVSPGAIRRGAFVERCEPLDVVFFKGRNWPGTGAVHRAPPTTEPRLLLSIEPAWAKPMA